MYEQALTLSAVTHCHYYEEEISEIGGIHHHGDVCYHCSVRNISHKLEIDYLNILYLYIGN